nr:hypothetical protein [Tanacetum cinerariifolium]
MGDMVGVTDSPQITLNALSGLNSYQTMRVKRRVGKQVVHILIDCGNTHNFLDIHATNKLSCRLAKTTPIGEMVLGIQWLATLGDMQCNFKKLIMKFNHKGRQLVLRGMDNTYIHWMQCNEGMLKQAELSSMDLCVYPVQLCQMENVRSVSVEVEQDLTQFDEVFEVPKDLSPKRSHDHQIPSMPNTPPINMRPYRYPPNQKDAIEGMVKEFMDSGVIRASLSPFSSHIVMVKKKDDTWRMCIDYKQLKEHCDHLAQVLQVMKDNTLYAKRTKCYFIVPQVEYLGLIISAQGVSTDPSKIEAMQKLPVPLVLKQLRGFLGLTGYYRRFIKDYASISQPLVALTKKDTFKWNPSAELAYHKLKEAMVKTPMLDLPNFEQEFVVETDASGKGIGAVLCQNGHPIAYWSKTLSAKHQALLTYEKEFLAVVAALDKWKGYLLNSTSKLGHIISA